jgi:DNA-binding IclR family transcriptional regulator
MSSTNVVKSVGRVLEVLELFAQRREPMSGIQICRALNYPKSSANAILKSLVKLGYLALNTDNLKYFPSLRVTYLGDWLPGQLLGTIETTKPLESLHEATSETVTLSMQNGFHMQFIRVLPGTFPISLRASEGFMAPIFGTAVGAAYLSTISDQAILSLYERAVNRGELKGQIVSLEAVMEDVVAARKDGCARGYDRILPDTGAIAAPLKTQAHDQHLVVGVGGLSARIRRSEDTIVENLKRVIRQYVDAPE